MHYSSTPEPGLTQNKSSTLHTNHAQLPDDKSFRQGKQSQILGFIEQTFISRDNSMGVSWLTRVFYLSITILADQLHVTDLNLMFICVLFASQLI